MTTKTQAILKKESPLRDIWPDGKVPIVSPVVQHGKGREGEEVHLYQVDLEKCSDDQIETILEEMRKRVSPEVTLEDLFQEGFRIKMEHTSGFAMSMGMFT